METRRKFEDWLRYTMPWQLSLSRSKRVAMDRVFTQFSGLAMELEDKSPEAFERFFNALKNRVSKVATWRRPKGTYLAHNMTNGQLEKYPDGRVKYHLADKQPPRSWNPKRR